MKVKLGVCTAESANTFLQEFKGDVMRVPDDDGKLDPKHKVVYSGVRKCQHQVQKRVSPVTGVLKKDQDSTNHDDEWKQFEIQFNLAVDNLRKMIRF